MSHLPPLFISHGAPTFAIEPGLAGPRLSELGRTMPRPAAVLVVSPHWMSRTVLVGASPMPRTIHDFGGFPAELYTLDYPAPGHPELAERAARRLAEDGWHVGLDAQRGLDHGAWVPLMHMFPRADVPVFQVSMPVTLDAQGAWDLGRSLAPLADEGVLILASGSITHNLYEFRQGHDTPEPYAQEFVHWIRGAVTTGQSAKLRRTLEEAPHALRAHPTPDHFLPLLVAAGAAGEGKPGSVIDGGMTHGVLAMDAYRFAGDAPARSGSDQVAQFA